MVGGGNTGGKLQRAKILKYPESKINAFQLNCKNPWKAAWRWLGA